MSRLALLLAACLPAWVVAPRTSEAHLDTQKPPAATCGTCAGKGEARLVCEDCGGDGKVNCIDCILRSSDLRWKRTLQAAEQKDPELAKRLRESHDNLQDTYRAIAENMTSSTGLLPPGRLPCHARCRGGKCLVYPLPCKVCKEQGWLQCPTCKTKGEVRCDACWGSGKRVRPCPECIGSGQAPDPLARTVEAHACPWCSGATGRACGRCGEDGLEEGTCEGCLGSGELLCKTCNGTREAVCRACCGTGDDSVSSLDHRSNRCKSCKAKGVVACTSCQKGRVRCGSCEGDGKVRIGCALCLGFHVVPCEGCWSNSEEAWVVTARRLAAASKAREAHAHWVVALQRAELRTRSERDVFVGTDAEQRALEARHAKELRELQQAVAAAVKALPADPP
jgi:hypothetical protein